MLNFLIFTVCSFSFPFKLNGNPRINPPILYSFKNSLILGKSFLVPFLVTVFSGVAIVNEEVASDVGDKWKESLGHTEIQAGTTRLGSTVCVG